MSPIYQKCLDDISVAKGINRSIMDTSMNGWMERFVTTYRFSKNFWKTFLEQLDHSVACSPPGSTEFMM